MSYKKKCEKKNSLALNIITLILICVYSWNIFKKNFCGHVCVHITYLSWVFPFPIACWSVPQKPLTLPLTKSYPLDVWRCSYIDVNPFDNGTNPIYVPVLDTTENLTYILGDFADVVKQWITLIKCVWQQVFSIIPICWPVRVIV